jgi:uncharacterized OB-fold protein
MTEYRKPIPTPDRVTEEFWDAARRHELLIQRCRDCGASQFLPQSCCRACLSQRIQWVAASGKGKIYSYTIVHRPPTPKFQEDVPYAVALVELDEGVRMMSNIVGIGPQDVRVGMAVEVVFEGISPTISLPKFRPSEAS